MPVIKSAKKKLRQDQKRTAQNNHLETLVKRAFKKALKTPSEKTVNAAISLADKAAKKNIFHKNKAARMKSTLAKLLKSKVKRAKINSSAKKKKV